jgi:hypothetical protein
MSDMKRFNRFMTCTLVAAGMIGASTPSHGYRMIQSPFTGRQTGGYLVSCNDPGGFAHWDARNIRWYNNTAGQGVDKSSALQSAMHTWSSVPWAAHVLIYGGTTSVSWATDGVNTLSWGTGNGCTEPCLALTALVLQSGQVIVESDITFNADRPWNMDGTAYDTQAVATHELGHSLGIFHTEVLSTPRPTMYENYFGTDGRSLEVDDEAALQCSESRYPLVRSYGGNFEIPNCRGGKGWAWDANHPNEELFVDVYLNGILLHTVLADTFRQGLYDLGYGDGDHAFTYPMNPEGVGSGASELRVRHNSTNLDLSNSPRTVYCRMNLFNNLMPVEPPTSAQGGSEFGVEISSAISGFVTDLKFYKAAGETGSHVGRLWSSTGQVLASVTFVNETADGWQSAKLSNPVLIQAGQRYRVSYTAYTVKSKTNCGLLSPVTNYPLTAHYGYTSPVGGTFPNTANCNNFFVDVRFDQ